MKHLTPGVVVGPGGIYRQTWPITRESMPDDEQVARLPDPHAASTARLWRQIARSWQDVLYQSNGGDSSITHRASVPFAETAKPEHRRNCHAIGLWTWTAAWVIAAIICTIIAMIGVTR